MRARPQAALQHVGLQRDVWVCEARRGGVKSTAKGSQCRVKCRVSQKGSSPLEVTSGRARAACGSCPPRRWARRLPAVALGHWVRGNCNCASAACFVRRPMPPHRQLQRPTMVWNTRMHWWWAQLAAAQAGCRRMQGMRVALGRPPSDLPMPVVSLPCAMRPTLPPLRPTPPPSCLAAHATAPRIACLDKQGAHPGGMRVICPQHTQPHHPVHHTLEKHNVRGRRDRPGARQTQRAPYKQH